MTCLAIIPSFVRNDKEVEVTLQTLKTLRQHEPDLEVLMVDDCSPYESGVDVLREKCAATDGARLHEKDLNEGFSAAVNVGLQECLDRGLDGILVNADIEFVMPFVEAFEQTVDSQGRPAAVVGALLFYPNHTIQHGGVFFGLFERGFDHKFRFSPGGLPEAHQSAVCPVTGALQYIRHSALEAVGLYDTGFGLGFEDVSFCLGVFDVGLECIYNPQVRAVHHESLFRGQRSEKIDKWHQDSLEYLRKKHGSTPLGRFVPSLV